MIVGTVDRSTLRRALTPQAFRHYVLKRALEQDAAGEATDECVLVERSGVMVKTVDGSPRNIKITHRDDLLMAEAMMRGTAE